MCLNCTSCEEAQLKSQTSTFEVPILIIKNMCLNCTSCEKVLLKFRALKILHEPKYYNLVTYLDQI